jgi:regulatory protein
MEIVTPHQALAKSYKFCAYQERSQKEVRDKLISFKLENEEIENIIVKLIEENFLNEERFALAYAGGKFRIKHWGKNKIKQSLKQHDVSEYCIKKALSNIKNDEYYLTIEKLVSKKNKELKEEKNRLARARKVLVFMITKGYEHELVMKEIRSQLKLD